MELELLICGSLFLLPWTSLLIRFDFWEPSSCSVPTLAFYTTSFLHLLPFIVCPVPSATWSPEPVLIHTTAEPLDWQSPEALLLETSTCALTCHFPCWCLSSVYHVSSHHSGLCLSYSTFPIDERDWNQWTDVKLERNRGSMTMTANTSGALVWLWHKHIGFLPFSLFDINVLVFIVQWVVVSFHFDVCQFVKSTIMPFSFPILIKVMPLLILFSLMFWCPATISSISSNKWSVSFIDGCTWVAWLFLMKDNVKSISIVCPVLPYDLDTIWEANQVFMISWLVFLSNVIVILRAEDYMRTNCVKAHNFHLDGA